MGNFISHRAVEDGHHESSFLDFKLQSYSDSKEWLKDVTAFANSRGGRIILGIEEDEHGRASKLVGLSTDKLDIEIQRLQNWLREHSDPDVSGAVKILPEIDHEGKKFLVIEISESDLAPHRLNVSSQKYDRHVYVRKGRDNVPVGMLEIRDMIRDTQRTPRLISEFISERQKELVIASPLGRRETRYLLFHICPSQGFGSRNLVDWALQRKTEVSWSSDLGWTPIRSNASGAIAHQDTRNQRGHGSYCQLFYNSCTELLFNDLIVVENETEAGIIWSHINRDLKHVVNRMHRSTACENFSVHSKLVGMEDCILQKYIGRGGIYRKFQAENIPNRVELPPVSISINADGHANEQDLREIAKLISRVWEKDDLIGPEQG